MASKGRRNQSLLRKVGVGALLLAQLSDVEAWVSPMCESRIPISHRTKTSALQVSSLEDLPGRRINSRAVETNVFSAYLQDKLSISKETLGLGILLTVPIVWGTYAPAVQLLYGVDPAVPGPVFSAAYFTVASAFTSSVLLATSKLTATNEASSDESLFPVGPGLELGAYIFVANTMHVVGLQSVPADRAGFLLQLTTVFVPLVEAAFANDFFAISGTTWGACMLALAGIALMGLDIPNPFDKFHLTQAPSFADFDTALGSSAISADPISTMAAMESSFVPPEASTLADSVSTDGAWSVLDGLASGDFLIVAAALLYSLHIIRLGHWTSKTRILNLTAAKTTAEAMYSSAFVVATMALAGGSAATDGFMGFLQQSGQNAVDFFGTFAQRWSEGSLPMSSLTTIAAATTWTGIMSTAYIVFAQGTGQKTVKPSDANLIYSLQPIFNAIFAFWLLGENPTPSTFVGGALIGAAVYTVATSPAVGQEKQ